MCGGVGGVGVGGKFIHYDRGASAWEWGTGGGGGGGGGDGGIGKRGKARLGGRDWKERRDEERERDGENERDGGRLRRERRDGEKD